MKNLNWLVLKFELCFFILINIDLIYYYVIEHKQSFSSPTIFWTIYSNRMTPSTMYLTKRIIMFAGHQEDPKSCILIKEVLSAI